MDAEIVARAQQGDEVAFAAITQVTHGRLKQVAFRILRDRHLAEDAMQQALVEMWRKLPSLRDLHKFDAWSYRILVNACYREAKRHQRSFSMIPGDGDVVAPDGTSTVNDRDQLERAFARLSMDHRAVLVMHYYLDLTIEETAAALGISSGTAKSRLHRAMEKLRLALHVDSEPTRAMRTETTS